MPNFSAQDLLSHGHNFFSISQRHFYDAFNKHPYLTVVLPILVFYMSLVRYLRFNNVDRLKKKYGYTHLQHSFDAMTVEEAQEIERNMAEWDFPFLFEFGWIIEFLKTATTPHVSKLICDTGHFGNPDPIIAHARQQDTVCLMTAMTAQPMDSEFSALVLARINEHHNKYGDRINSDVLLWLIWMFMDGPVRWINLGGWRKLEPFEVHAMWIIWRELAIRMGCKWVPTHLHEFEHFRQELALAEQRPSKYNTLFSDYIVDAVIFTVPDFLKPIARKCIIAVLDSDVVCFNEYQKEFSPILRRVLFFLLKTWALVQRHFCLPRIWGRVLTPSELNSNGLVNFPDYTYPSTPFYIAPTLWNRWGPTAILLRLRGLPVPGPKYGSIGVKWESMGAKLRDATLQARSEAHVREEASLLLSQGWGYRANVKFQARPIIIDKHWGQGYGTREFAYTEEALAANDHKGRK